MDTFPSPSTKRRWQFQSLLFLALSVLPVQAASIPFAEDLYPQLKELMEMASVDGTELQLNNLRIEERQGDLDATRGQRRPQVNAYARLAGAYETRDDIDNRFRGSANANLTVSKPLFHWGVLDDRETVAENRVTLEGIEAGRRGERHFMEIRKAYLYWLLMHERKQVLEQSIELSQSFVDARRQLVEVGQSSEQDVLEMEARLLENLEALSYIEKRIIDLESSLVRLIGNGFRPESLTSQSLSRISPMTSDEFTELSNELRSNQTNLSLPEAETFSMLEDIESQNLEILDKQHHPKVDFVAGIFSDQIEALNNEDFVLRTQYFAGLQVNWSIFNGWQTDGWKRSVLARKRTYGLQLEAARTSAQQRRETLLADLQLNLKQVEARQKRADILQRRQTLVREQVERNLLPGSELIEVEVNYLDVRQRLMDARVNYMINLMELGILLGQDPARASYLEES